MKLKHLVVAGCLLLLTTTLTLTQADHVPTQSDVTTESNDGEVGEIFFASSGEESELRNRRLDGPTIQSVRQSDAGVTDAPRTLADEIVLTGPDGDTVVTREQALRDAQRALDIWTSREAALVEQLRERPDPIREAYLETVRESADRTAAFIAHVSP